MRDFPQFPCCNDKERRITTGILVINEGAGQGDKGAKKPEVTTWFQCLCAYVSIRAPQTPHLIPELMAYMATISQDYVGLAWAAAFYRQAVLINNVRWSVITMCFTGMASTTK